MNNQIYPCLWFDGNAKAAADFYCSVFKDAKILTSTSMVVLFELNGNRFMGLNGGSQFTFSEAISFVINCDTQEEIDYYWEKLIAEGGRESMCGWLKDQFGISWQVVPSMLGELMSDHKRSGRVMQAMMKMRKISIKTLEDA